MFQVLAIFQKKRKCLSPLLYLELSFHELFLSQVFPKGMFGDGTASLPPLFPAQPFGIGATSIDGVFEGFVFLLLACESFALSSSWPDVFSHLGSLGFCSSNLWLLGHPRAGAILQACTAAAFPHPFFIDTVWASSLVVMDFVQLTR